MALGGQRLVALISATAVALAYLFPITTPEATAVSGLEFDRNYDDRLASLSQAIPGFAGFTIDDTAGEFHVWSTRGRIDAAPQLLADYLANPDLAHLTAIHHPATFDFLQLKAWKDLASEHVLALPNTVFADANEGINRVEIGISDTTAEPLVRQVMEGLGVPTEAVRITMTSPVVQDSLRVTHRPLVGGLQINWRDNANASWICSLGWPALHGGAAGIITNSHCSAEQGGVHATIYGQHTRGAATDIAREQVDPQYFGGGTCPAGRLCRRSDSLFAILTINQLFLDLGRIADPEHVDFDPSVWNGVDKFRITSEFPPGQGQVVTKVGRTTGQSSGTVDNTCATVLVAATNLALLCQSHAPYGSSGGDSGGPVFRIMNGRDVSLGGIHWGSGGWYSNIVEVQGELGPVTSCASGFSC